MSRIILASGSPRRKELLAQIGLDFQVITSEAEETITKINPDEIVMELSEKKARAVKDQLEECRDASDKLVIIGADTIVYHDGVVLGKPKDDEMAAEMIRSLSGQTHQVYTGVSVFCGDRLLQFYEKTDVTVYPMTEDEISSYIATGEPSDKAGAYGIQGAFAAYVRKIEGDYNNVVGLPVARLYHELRKAEMI